MSKRAAINIIYAGALRVALLVSLSILAFLIGSIIWQGSKALSFDFIFSDARDFGASGGIRYQILGSLILIAVSALLVLPLALGTAIYRSEYVTSEKLGRRIDLAIFSLNGIPSITYGLFGLIIFVNLFGMGISWSIGSILLAMMILPTVTVSSYQAMRAIPDSYRENSIALGLSRAQMVRRVILPQSLHGVVTGLLIGLARAIGETAPIMFVATAFSGVTWPRSINEPVSTLPTHILALAQQATNPDALRNAWGTSFSLILIVILLSTLAYVARHKLQPGRPQ
jgi:phosphate transport system permease protein